MKSVITIDSDPEEGIIQSDNFSKFDPIEISQQDKFPYCLVGRTSSEFKGKRISKFGVGILIGPAVVLTAGHNLTNIDKETGALEIADAVSFTVSTNGDFEPFEPIVSNDFYIPEDFIHGVKVQVAKQQLLNDWSVIYLNVPIGESVKKLYGLENFPYVKTGENGLFSYFNDNSKQNLSNLGAGINPEISIIGYSECREEFDEKAFSTENNNLLYNTASTNQLSQMTNINQNPISKKGGDFEDPKKDININIQISTKEEGMVASQIFSNNMNKLNILKLENNNNKKHPDPVDFIILNSENKEVNKYQTLINHKLTNRSDKTLISESMGRLEDFNDALKYKISTYKGQSGSPIFLRLRKIQSNKPGLNDGTEQSNDNFFDSNTNNRSNKNESEFIYTFIGIHSRRGPLLYDNIICNQSPPSEKKMLNNVSNCSNDDEYHDTKNNFLGLGVNSPGLIHDEEVDKVETQVRKMRNSENRRSGNSLNEKDKNNDQNLINQIAIHGICEFNEGILIMGKNVLPISSAVENNLQMRDKKSNGLGVPINTQVASSSNNNSNGNTNINSNSSSNSNVATPYKSPFCNVTLTLNGKEKLVGLFKRDLKLDTLFQFGSEILNVDKNYILFIFNTGKAEKRISGKFDSNKQLGLYLDEDQPSAAFEVDLNMKYGDELGQRVIEKYMETYDLNVEDIRENFKPEHMKRLFDLIFEEISDFADIHPTFGKLFSKIRGFILSKIGLSD